MPFNLTVDIHWSPLSPDNNPTSTPEPDLNPASIAPNPTLKLTDKDMHELTDLSDEEVDRKTAMMAALDDFLASVANSQKTETMCTPSSSRVQVGYR